MSQVVSLSFFRFARPAARLWAFAMMLGARGPLSRIEGLEFWKLCGSGTGEGFTPLPNTQVYAILAVWPDAATARARLAEAEIFRRYRRRASESWTVLLSPLASRGAWAGRTPFRAGAPADPAPGALAALTRATIRPAILARFWRHVPGVSGVIGANREVAFKIGLGEVPWLHQITFSIWPDAASMARFARQGPHAAAIRAVREERWFREELYARFRVIADIGTWQGGSPLPGQEAT